MCYYIVLLPCVTILCYYIVLLPCVTILCYYIILYYFLVLLYCVLYCVTSLCYYISMRKLILLLISNIVIYCTLSSTEIQRRLIQTKVYFNVFTLPEKKELKSLQKRQLQKKFSPVCMLSIELASMNAFTLCDNSKILFFIKMFRCCKAFVMPCCCVLWRPFFLEKSPYFVSYLCNDKVQK